MDGEDACGKKEHAAAERARLTAGGQELAERARLTAGRQGVKK